MRAVLVGLLIVVISALPALAGPCDGTTLAQASEPDITAALNLTKDQQGKLEAVHQRFAGQKQSLRQSVASRRQELVSLMSSDTPDRGAVDRCLQDIVSMEGRRQKLVVDEYFEVMQILRPEQRAIFRNQVVKRIVR